MFSPADQWSSRRFLWRSPRSWKNCHCSKQSTSPASTASTCGRNACETTTSEMPDRTSARTLNNHLIPNIWQFFCWINLETWKLWCGHQQEARWRLATKRMPQHNMQNYFNQRIPTNYVRGTCNIGTAAPCIYSVRTNVKSSVLLLLLVLVWEYMFIHHGECEENITE